MKKIPSHPLLRLMLPLLLLPLVPVLMVCAVAMPPLWVLSPGLLLFAALIFTGLDDQTNGKL